MLESSGYTIFAMHGVANAARLADIPPERSPDAIKTLSGGPIMLVIPGFTGKDTCDGITRRELLRVGGSAVFGFSLANLFSLQKATAKQNYTGGPGFGKAKSVILVYLQGGPSHLDLWDPKDNVPDNVRSVFKAIDTKLPGVKVPEVMPNLPQPLDTLPLIRSSSY